MKLHFGTNAYMALRQPHHAEEVFSLVHKNREHLSVWLPWVQEYQHINDAHTSIQSNIDQAAQNSSLNLGIWIEEVFCGMVGFTHIDSVRKKASLGYWLDKNCTGKGWMTQACRTLITHGFESLELREIHAECAKRNLLSRKVLEGIGFTNHEIVQGPDWAKQQGLLYLRYRMTHQEWNSPLR